MTYRVRIPRTAPASATTDQIREEMHRLRESRMILVLMAEDLGLTVPRSCCPHAGASACVVCASDWLVAHVRESAVL